MKEIQLTQGKVSLVDDEDYEWLNQWKWSARKGKNGNWYAIRWEKQRKNVHLHREVLGLWKNNDILADHIDGNGLNNQKRNLRICDNARNSMNRSIGRNNTSGYKGVTWQKSRLKFRCYIKFNQKQIHIGYFESEIDAAKAYDRIASQIFGEFAKLNFPTSA